MLRRNASWRVPGTAGPLKAPHSQLYPLCSAEFH